MDGDAIGERILAFAADHFALARGERGEEVIEGRVAGVDPVELTVGALQIAARAEQFPLRLRKEGDVHRGGIRALADIGQ